MDQTIINDRRRAYKYLAASSSVRVRHFAPILQTLARPAIFLAAGRSLPKPRRGYQLHRHRRLATPAEGIGSPRSEASDSSSLWLTDGPATVTIASPPDHLRPHRRVQHHHGEPAHLLSFVLHRIVARSILTACTRVRRRSASPASELRRPFLGGACTIEFTAASLSDWCRRFARGSTTPPATIATAAGEVLACHVVPPWLLTWTNPTSQ
jgi:hypothetical protein